MELFQNKSIAQVLTDPCNLGRNLRATPNIVNYVTKKKSGEEALSKSSSPRVITVITRSNFNKKVLLLAVKLVEAYVSQDIFLIDSQVDTRSTFLIEDKEVTSYHI